MLSRWRLGIWHAQLLLLAAGAICARGIQVARAQTAQAREAAKWPGAELFADGKVSQIQIQIRQQGLAQLRKEPRQPVRAKVTEAGIEYLDVAVHLKGSVGSFRPVDGKPALTLDFAQFRREQRFHGLRRIHLNNSVEDPSYCCEQLGGELFRAGGIPAPRVSRATVTLDGRELGLYVLKEGFTEDFLACYFAKIGGNLFEPSEGHDVNQHLKRMMILAPNQDRSAMHRLAQAVAEKDLNARWQGLRDTLDVERFIRFMALEVMLGHRDGYCLARNNFRLYQDLDTGRMVFLPHGMDQLFGSAQIPWKPHMAGLVAQALIETPQSEQEYRANFRTLFETLLNPEVLSNRVQTIVMPLRSYLDKSELEKIEVEAASLNRRIAERYIYLKQELVRPEPAALVFTNGTCPLAGWRKVDEPASGRMDECVGPGQVKSLRIMLNGDASASWRTTAWLEPGKYQFRGKARVQDVAPLSFGAHHGAGLRVGGQSRQTPDLVGTSDWRSLTADFQVEGAPREVEFICELRGAGGQVWFDSGSLEVLKGSASQ